MTDMPIIAAPEPEEPRVPFPRVGCDRYIHMTQRWEENGMAEASRASARRQDTESHEAG